MTDCRNIQRNDAAAIARCGLSLKTIEDSSVAKGKLNLDAKGGKTKDTYVEPNRNFPGATVAAAPKKDGIIKSEPNYRTLGAPKPGPVSPKEFEKLVPKEEDINVDNRTGKKTEESDKGLFLPNGSKITKARVFNPADSHFQNAEDRQAHAGWMAARAKALGYLVINPPSGFVAGTLLFIPTARTKRG